MDIEGEHFLVMEPVEVTARFDEQGTITPVQFTWKGAVHHLESTGRRWVDETGQHILVMDTSGRIFELTFTRAEGRWFIGHGDPAHKVV